MNQACIYMRKVGEAVKDGWQPIAAEAQNLRMAQVDVQLRRDRYRHRRGSDPTGNVLMVRALLLHRLPMTSAAFAAAFLSLRA
jgi:hypothetical protein